MTNLTMADTILQRIDEAAADGNWPAAFAGAERMLACVTQGIVAGDFSLIDAAAGDATGAASRIVLRADVTPMPSPEAVVWLMKAAAAVAEVGRATMRRPEDGDTRTRILDRLASAGPSGMSNTELVAACRRSPETVSRMLRVLRSEGVVEFASAGRVVRNWLVGARAAGTVAQDVVAPIQDAHAVQEAMVVRSEEFAQTPMDMLRDPGIDLPHVGAGEILASERIVAIGRSEGDPAANDTASVRNFQQA